MATKQQAPWASGKHKPAARRRNPVSNAGRSMLGRVVGNAKRGCKKTLRKHPSVGIAASVLLGIVAVLSLVLGMVLESVLYYLVMAVAGLGALAIRRAQQMERTRQSAPPKPSTAGPRKPPPEQPDGEPPAPKPAEDVVECTRTGKVAAECDCVRMHVMSGRGVKKFGRPLGTPIGKQRDRP